MYTMEDLVAEFGRKPRTIRAYIQAGILPRPIGADRYARYSPVHWNRLREIAAIPPSARTRAEWRDRFHPAP